MIIFAMSNVFMPYSQQLTILQFMNKEECRNNTKLPKIAIFASGSGTNTENIVEYFKEKKTAIISLILTNKIEAYVIERAKLHNIPSIVFNKDEFKTSVLALLIKEKIDLIVLAGFLWLIPEEITKAFDHKIINIHPALLPDFGGKGMFGDHVHKKVIESGRTESGITIHYVNEKYDEGNIIFQAKCKIEPNDDYLSLANKIHELEYEHYPRIIEELLID